MTGPPVVVVMGVAGAGKSTLARALAEWLEVPFLEADDLHPPASVAKMRAGRPLTDKDRAPWLDAVAAWIGGLGGGGAVIACSALKRAYRDRLRGAGPALRLVHVAGPRALVAERMAARRDHYFPVSLIQSQYQALEPPDPDEEAIEVDIRLSPEAQLDLVVGALGS